MKIDELRLVVNIVSFFPNLKYCRWKFAGVSLNIQHELASKVARFLFSDVYIFVAQGFFIDAPASIAEGMRYQEKDGYYAVLSQAAQTTLIIANTYLQYCPEDI